MAPLTDQLLALRIPQKLRHGPSEELDSHITKNMIGTIQQISPSKLAQCDDDALDPFQDTLAYLYVLNAKSNAVFSKSKSASNSELLQKTARFVNVFDPLQMRYAGDTWLTLTDDIYRMDASGASNQRSTTALLAAAMTRLDPSCGTFTDTHLRLIRLALETKRYHDALPVLYHDIYSLPAKKSPPDLFLCSDHHLSNGYITYESRLTKKIERNDVIEYFLLGAMVLIAVKDWSRAQHYLEHVLSTPTNSTATALMLDAYQKWLLVGLMNSGQAPSEPSGADSSALRTLQSLSRAYEAIVEAFALEERKKLEAQAQEGRSLFIEEGNFGLVQEVVEQHQKLSVSKLASIYAAVPIERIAQEYNSSISATEEYLGSLIAEGQLQATIEKADGNSQAVLRFSQDQHHGSKSELLSKEELISMTRRIEALNVHVNDEDRRLSTSQEYLEHVRLKKRKEESGETVNELKGAGQLGKGDSEDESMMTDVP